MGITKRYRLVVDYEVEVTDFEPSGWHPTDFYPDFGTPGFNEWADNQRRLFEAVLANPRRVEQMCQRSLLGSLEMDIDDVRRQFKVPKDEDLYAETFAEMPDDDKTYWENICSEGLFCENADFVTYRFQPVIKSCTLQNLETEELIQAQPYKPDVPLIEPVNRETVFRHVEAFGTWAEPASQQYEPSVEDLEEMKKQVSLKTQVPDGIREFLRRFVIQRTIMSHVNLETPNPSCTDEEIVREANEWAASNSVLCKQDLYCLKTILRMLGLPRLFRDNFVQDMRKKTFDNLCQAAVQHESLLAIRTS